MRKWKPESLGAVHTHTHTRVYLENQEQAKI